MTFLTPTWRVIGASVTGTSHHRMGRGCDDAHSYRLYGNDLLLLVAADGAGSATQSAVGAATAVRSALDAAEQRLVQQSEPDQQEQWYDVLRCTLRAAHNSLHKLAEGDMDPPQAHATTEQLQTDIVPALRDFATTLILAIVTPHWLAVAQVGDGAVVIHRADGTLASLTLPSQGEYLNETNFLTDTEYLSQAEYTVLSCPSIQGIALLTDGLQLVSMKFPENTPHQPFFIPLFRFAAGPNATEVELRGFLESERICERTDDDKTLILAVYQ